MRVAPAWLPDETLFSLCSRIHRLSANGLAEDTCRMLFGRARAGCAHDFPTYLDEFVWRADGAWGTAQEIIATRTIAPFYLALCDPRAAENTIACFRRGGMTSIKFQLGLLTSRFRAHHPLKACVDCLREDLQRFHVQYWHVTHQSPGVWVCPNHQKPLLESSIKSNGVRRFDWCLPGDAELTASSGLNDLSELSMRALVRLARDAVVLWRLPASAIDTTRLAQTYRGRAASLGFVRSSGAPDWARLGTAYADHLAPLRVMPALVMLPDDQRQATTEVKRLLSEPRSGTHPIRHLALITWLFQNFDSFMAAYQQAPNMPTGRDEPSTARSGDTEPNDRRRSELLDLIRGGTSVTAAGGLVGIDTLTAQAWATDAGIEIQRRPQRILPELRGRIERAIRTGTDKADVARRFGISVSTVTTLMRTTVGLQRAWHDARRSASQKKHRAIWSRTIKANAGAGIKEVRTIAPSAYAWLYRNDRAWLDASTRCLPTKRIGNHAAVDWDRRDEVLAKEVQVAIERIGAANPKGQVSVGAVCQAVPELRAKIGRLNRLPLTERALRAATHGRKGKPSLI